MKSNNNTIVKNGHATGNLDLYQRKMSLKGQHREQSSVNKLRYRIFLAKNMYCYDTVKCFCVKISCAVIHYHFIAFLRNENATNGDI